MQPEVQKEEINVEAFEEKIKKIQHTIAMLKRKNMDINFQSRLEQFKNTNPSGFQALGNNIEDNMKSMVVEKFLNSEEMKEHIKEHEDIINTLTQIYMPEELANNINSEETNTLKGMGGLLLILVSLLLPIFPSFAFLCIGIKVSIFFYAMHKVLKYFNIAPLIRYFMELMCFLLTKTLSIYSLKRKFMAKYSVEEMEKLVRLIYEKTKKEVDTLTSLYIDYFQNSENGNLYSLSKTLRLKIKEIDDNYERNKENYNKKENKTLKDAATHFFDLISYYYSIVNIANKFTKEIEYRTKIEELYQEKASLEKELESLKIKKSSSGEELQNLFNKI